MKNKYRIGEHIHYKQCRFCGSNEMQVVIQLGDMPLAGGFFKKNPPATTLANEPYYPLDVCFCPSCYLLQTNAVIPADTLFKDYFYRTSAITTLTKHFGQLAQSLPQLVPGDDPFIVEIGANDGAFISQVQAQGYRCLGVDPAHNIVIDAQAQGVPLMEAYFNLATAEEIVRGHGQADAIFSFNTLAHIEDMHQVALGINHVLHPAGILVFEIHYLGSVLEHTQYDMIYHEHQYYYSLLALEHFFLSHQMEIFDVQIVPTHAGSLRVSVQKQKTGIRPVSSSVALLRQEEIDKGYDKIATYASYNAKMQENKKKLLQLLTKLKKQGKKIAGYGASGRGTIVSNYCQLDDRYLDYIVDDAPAKLGVVTPGVNLTVHSSQILTTADKPDYCVLLAWSFWDEIKQRNMEYLKQGGAFILPLPEVTVIKGLS